MRLNFRKDTTVLVGLLLVASLVTIGVAGVASAQSSEFSTNETVTVSNESTPINVSVTWNESVTDPANTSASVTFYNETEYADDPANATIALEDTIAADAGNTTTASYDENASGLELDTDYRVVVSGPSTVDSASVEDSSGFLGGVPGVGDDLGGGGMLVGGAVIGLAVIGAAIWTMRD
ncbi:hypothetical protein A6E15_02135 [Natrinema saccharevitans]|uniref:Uncharacterized protein n=1 Tax=Natrinema saccharevitans TaxID=301967 RepID=A0A1S8ATT6_9EURY|nr:hypothetical protein [Natrinema saccharevitans]OLZ39854.1 hypothetical protein A6E15_02135 [Natrinema saccharevitans]